MDSDDESFDEHDSGNVSSGDDDFAMDVDINQPARSQQEEDYPFEVLTTEEIVQHMVDCIKDVNTVVEVTHRFCPNQLCFCCYYYLFFVCAECLCVCFCM